jgi:hypothetical protein
VLRHYVERGRRQQRSVCCGPKGEGKGEGAGREQRAESGVKDWAQGQRFITAGESVLHACYVPSLVPQEMSCMLQKEKMENMLT